MTSTLNPNAVAYTPLVDNSNDEPSVRETKSHNDPSEEKVAENNRDEQEQEEQLSKFIIKHNGKKTKIQSSVWLQMRKCNVANPTKDGISGVDLIDALRNYTSDGEQYLGGVEMIISKRIGHYDHELEELWLKRALTSGEDPNDWEIVLLVKELQNDGTSHGWYKAMLQNHNTKKYSGRSFSLFKDDKEKQTIYRMKKLQQKRPPAAMALNTKWFVEWSKLLTDHTFWNQLKNQLVN